MPSLPSLPPTPARHNPRSNIPTPSKRSVSASSSQADLVGTSPSSPRRSPSSSPGRLPRPTSTTSPQTLSRRTSGESERSQLSIPSNDDAARMPPPPLPSRTRSTRTSTASSSRESGEVKQSAFGRAGTALRRAAGVRSLKEAKDESKKETVSGGSSRTLRSSSNTAALKSSTTSKSRDEKGVFGLGRTMSLRSSRTSSEPAKKSPTTTAPSKSSRPTGPAASSTSGSRSRPSSMYGNPTTSSTSLVSGTTTTTSNKRGPPPTSSSTRGHRRNQSTPSVASPSTDKDVRPSTSSGPKPPKRPVFSTHQQAFTPKREPASSSRPKSLPPPPLDASTTHSQTELLQYTCLYASSHATYAQLTASATAKLKHRFETISKHHSRSREQLAKRQRRNDFAGLAAVIEAPHPIHASSDEKIQHFSEAIKKLEALQANEHRSLTRVFEDWITGYSPPPQPGFGFEHEASWILKRGRWIDGLGEDWKRECLYICRRIEGCVESVQAVIDAPGVVGVVAERWEAVANGMAEECQSMWQVEEKVVSRERNALRDVVEGVEVGLELEAGRTALWAQ